MDETRREMKKSIRAYGVPFVLEIVAELCREGESYWLHCPKISEQWGEVAAEVERARKTFR